MKTRFTVAIAPADGAVSTWAQPQTISSAMAAKVALIYIFGQNYQSPASHISASSSPR